jgi:hypothetical protein
MCNQDIFTWERGSEDIKNSKNPLWIKSEMSLASSRSMQKYFITKEDKNRLRVYLLNNNKNVLKMLNTL